MVNNKGSYSAIVNDPESVEAVMAARSQRRWKSVLSAAIACIAVTVFAGSMLALASQEESVPKRNVIMMISDGFGPASETFARQYHSWRDDLGYKAKLPLDEIHVGHSRTQSSSSLVTDSAAGATAFACAMKSYNGAIGVDPSEAPCGTVLESAKIHQGMLTGLVVTSRVTHATPASFSAHVAWRDWENTIAEQQIGYNPLGRVVDLMFGGGACEFKSNFTEGSCRADHRDLLQEAQDQFGWTVKQTRAEFDALDNDTPLPLMALFAPQHMSYDIDRNPSTEPSLKEMVEKALAILNKASKEQDKGFFLMIEGSRIDMAAHTNDPAAHLHDILQYHATAEAVRQFVRENPETVLISTSDHETGGFTAGRQVGSAYPEYKWNPVVISRVQNSSEALAAAWASAVQQERASIDYLRKVILDAGLGITDPTDEEIQQLNDWKKNGQNEMDLAYIFADMVSRRALIGWTTHGHTAVDVNLYAQGPGTEKLRGSHENTEIGDFIVEYLGLNLEDITQRLGKDKKIHSARRSEERDTDKLRSYYHG